MRRRIVSCIRPCSTGKPTGSFPPDDSNSGAYSGRGGNLEFVREAFCAAQAKTHAASGSVAVTERQIDIGDTGTLVFKHQADSGLPVLTERFEQDSTAAGIVDGVA